MSAVVEALGRVRAKITEAEREANRPSGSARLVAVSKTFPADAILPVLEAGQVDFGENRVQEAHAKWPALKEHFPAARLHIIGPLQTNKVREAMGLADAIHSLDRDKLAVTLAREAERLGACPDLFIQVNTGREPQKAGCLPEEADAFIRACRDDYQLPVRGLMCIPPVDDPASVHFALLKTIAEANGLAGLSMGMSDDYPLAVALGATHVRVGSAIFGAR